MPERRIRRREVEAFIDQKLTDGSVTTSVKLSEAQRSIVVETALAMSEIGHAQLLQTAERTDPRLLEKQQRLEAQYRRKRYPDPTREIDLSIAIALGHILTRRRLQELDRTSGEGITTAQKVTRHAIGEFRKRRNG
jgi:hypothetical protein